MSHTLLIIEDNEQNSYLMRFLLEKSGFAVIIAENGRDGIRMALEETPLAILLDIQLPEMDGYAVAAELGRHSELRDVPIIAVTSYAMAGDRETILAAEATGYMEKPINPATFVAEISRHLPTNRGAARHGHEHSHRRRPGREQVPAGGAAQGKRV